MYEIKEEEFNPKRKFKDGHNWFVNLDWIKKQIIKTYSNNLEKNIFRELFINELEDCYFFVLSGTPPKGYAIYQPEHKFLIVVDAWGKTIKHNNIILKNKGVK